MDHVFIFYHFEFKKLILHIVMINVTENFGRFLTLDEFEARVNYLFCRDHWLSTLSIFEHTDEMIVS